MKNILLGVDLNDKSELLIQKAQKLAKENNAKLWILHVISPLPEYVGFDVTPNYSAEDYNTFYVAQKTRLMQLVDQVKEAGVDAEGILLEGVATAVIIDESKKLSVDLIICGHHKHSILYNMLFGSNSVSVVRNSEIPVLVYPIK